MGENSVNSEDFDDIYRRNVSSVYLTALHYSENEHASEEITQEVFLKLYINRDNINPKGISTWLITTAKNMARNYKRDCWHEIPKDEIYETNEELWVESPEEDILSILQNEEYSKLTDCILEDLYRINTRWYDAVTITYVLEKPQREVAENMNVPLSVLHSMLYRAKKWIQNKYKEEYDRLKGK